MRWHGHLTATEIIRGTQQAGAWRGQLTYSLGLNDISNTTGDWNDALPWLQYEWLPLAVAGGVRAMAYVLPAKQEDQHASKALIAALRPYMAVEVCENVQAAWTWLYAQHQLA